MKQNAVPRIFPGLPPYLSTPKPDLKNPVQENAVVEGDSIKSYNDLSADIRERVTEFPDILVQNHESHIVMFKFHNDGGIDCKPVVCFCLRISNNMHVSLWVNGLEILSQELQWLLSHTNSTLILWSQLMELLKRYSEVALDIVSESAEIANLVTKLGASTERENSYNFIAEQLNLVCLSPHRY